jgi:hypothetical protein
MARAIGCGIADVDPVERMASAIFAGITAAARRRSPIGPAVRHWRHQHLAPPAASFCVAKTPNFVKIGRQIWPPRSLIIQVKCGTFTAADRFIRCLAQLER